MPCQLSRSMVLPVCADISMPLAPSDHHPPLAPPASSAVFPDCTMSLCYEAPMSFSPPPTYPARLFLTFCPFAHVSFLRIFRSPSFLSYFSPVFSFCTYSYLLSCLVLCPWILSHVFLPIVLSYATYTVHRHLYINGCSFKLCTYYRLPVFLSQYGS
jgi:hypothetical protein